MAGSPLWAAFGAALVFFGMTALGSPALAQSARLMAECRSDKTEKGIAACTTVLKGRIDRKARASALLSRGQNHWAARRFAEAEKDYGEVIKLAPDFMALFRDRGQIRFALGDQVGAMADFTMAIDKDPFDPDNHANRGYLKLLQNDFDGAEADVRKGLFWKSPHPRSQYFIGLLHYARGRYGDAVAAIDLSRSQGYKGNEAFITKARSLFYLGRFEEAAKEASEGLAAFPAVYDLAEIRARARLALREFTDALTDAEVAIRAAPAYGRAYATRGAIRLAMKDTGGANADADKAIALDATLFDAQELKADLLLGAEDRPGARALYQAMAARTDAKMAYDLASRQRAAARIVEMDKPKPILVSELDEAELKARCGRRDDPLRMQSCDRLVDTAQAPQARADRLILRSQAQPYGKQLADLERAVEAAPDYLTATLMRADGHLASYRYNADLGPIERAFADADSAVRRAAPGSPDLVAALETRARAAFMKGAYELALADTTRLVEIDPAASYALDRRASALLMAGRAGDAVVAFRELRRIVKEDERSWLQPDDFVVALIETGAVDEAIAELQEWEKKDLPGAGARESLRARALLRRGDLAAARDAADSAVTRSRSDLGARAVRGIVAARLDRPLDAVADLTEVIDKLAGIPFNASSRGITPGLHADILLHRGLARMRLNQSNAARADFTEAIRLAPDQASPYGERARILFRSDNPAALTDIAMALRIAPDEPRWQALAARINLATGDAAAGERYATAALASASPEADMRLVRAQARITLRKFGEAIADADEHLSRSSTDAEALLVGIAARRGAGDAKAALVAAEAARAANGADTRILLALADLRSEAGDVPGAIGAFEEAVRRPESALLANKRLGDLYAGIASEQLALGYYAKALEAPGRGAAEEALRNEARAARDALIRKLSSAKP